MFNRTTFTQADIDSYHWVKFNGKNGEIFYVLSGVILINAKSDSQQFLHLSTTCKINIPELPAGQGLYIRYHAPFAALNSIFDDGQAINGGYAVDNFDLVDVNPNANYGSKEITLRLKLGVCDKGAILFRVGFNVTITGSLRPLPPVDPCQAEKDKLSRLEQFCSGDIDLKIKAFEDQLSTASPAEKEAIRKRINELKQCPVNLAEARNALNRCKLLHTQITDTPN